MAGKFDNETNEQFVDEYDQDEDDLGDFIVYSDDDEESSKHKQELDDEHQQELEDEVEEEVQEEEEVEEEEEEEVEEEEEEAPVGQQEILSLREQLKEEIRRKNAAMAASALKPTLSSSSSSKNHMMPPVKDGYGTFFGPSKPVLARRVIEEGCSSIMKDIPSKKDVSLASKMRPGTVEKIQKQKFVSEEKRKVDTLRKNRDYSCLFTDDADTQLPTKDHPESSRASLLVPKTETQDAGPVNSARKKSRVITGQPATLSSTDRGLKGSGSLGKKAHPERKDTIAAGRNGSNLPNLKKKSPVLLSSSKGRELQPSLHNKRPQASIPGQKLRQQPESQRPQGNGRHPPLQGRSIQGQLIGQNRPAVQNGRLKSAQKQLVPSSKFKESHGVEKHTSVIKRRKTNDDRQIMHNYEEFAVSDEDESDMEADFASIQREERRSAALARKEDEEQLRLIKEEERRKRAMKSKRAAQK